MPPKKNLKKAQRRQENAASPQPERTNDELGWKRALGEFIDLRNKQLQGNQQFQNDLATIGQLYDSESRNQTLEEQERDLLAFNRRKKSQTKFAQAFHDLFTKWNFSLGSPVLVEECEHGRLVLQIALNSLPVNKLVRLAEKEIRVANRQFNRKPPRIFSGKGPERIRRKQEVLNKWPELLRRYKEKKSVKHAVQYTFPEWYKEAKRQGHEDNLVESIRLELKSLGLKFQE